jgi:hypothetical protein
VEGGIPQKQRKERARKEPQGKRTVCERWLKDLTQKELLKKKQVNSNK